MGRINRGEEMIDTDKYEGHGPAPWKYNRSHIFCTIEYKGEKKLAAIAQWVSTRSQDAELMADAPLLLAEVKRLREENEKQNNVLTTLDEMIHRSEEHVELMKAFEQGLGIPETWKEMVE